MNRLKIAAILMAAFLPFSCGKSSPEGGNPAPAPEPDDPGTYEAGFYVTVSGAGLFTGEDWNNAMSAEGLKELLLADGGTFSAEKAARINGKIIHLEQGIYPLASADNVKPTISGETAAFSVTLKGGYKSGIYTQYPDKYPTWLSGASDYHIFQLRGAAKLTLDGVGLTGGKGSGGGLAAAIVTAGSEIVLNRCKVCNNYNTANSGAFQVSGSARMTATNCRFYGNTAVHAGGLNIDGADTECTLTDCVFSGNSANNGQGGALKVSNGTITVTRCRFEGNYAEKRGGALWVAGSKDGNSVLFEDCVFQGNSCTNGGGALWQDGGSAVTFRGCTFEGNFAANGSAGALYANEGTEGLQGANLLIVENCRFRGNRAVGYNGGSIHVRGSQQYGNSTAHFKTCTFTGESTNKRGGLIAIGGDGAPLTTFDGCSVSDCSAGEIGGAFYNYATTGKLYFNACRFEGNSCEGNYGTEGSTPGDKENAFVGMNNCSVRRSHLARAGANSQQACWYGVNKGKVLFSNSSIIGVPTVQGNEKPAYGLIRLNSDKANARFVNNIIASTHSNGCGIYGGDSQTSLEVTGSYNKMSPVRTQKENTFTYTSGAGDDLTAYSSSFPGLEWGANGWTWNGGYSGSATLGSTAVINTAIQTFDADFYAWLDSIGALGKDIRGKDRGETSWPGAYQN